MKNKYDIKAKGYLVVIREIQLLLKKKRFSFTTLGAYLSFVFQADWDRRHKYYKAILPSDKQLAEFWNCNESSVYRNRKKLIKLNLFEEMNGITYIKNLDMFNFGTVKTLAKKETKIDKLHTYFAKSEMELAETMFEFEKMQETQAER